MQTQFTSHQLIGLNVLKGASHSRKRGAVRKELPRHVSSSKARGPHLMCLLGNHRKMTMQIGQIVSLVLEVLKLDI